MSDNDTSHMQGVNDNEEDADHGANATPGHPAESSTVTGLRRARADDEEQHGHPHNRPRTESAASRAEPSPPRAAAGGVAQNQNPARMQQSRTTMQFLLSAPQQQPFAQFSIVFDGAPVPIQEPTQDAAGQDDTRPPTESPQQQAFAFDTGPISGERFLAMISQLAGGLGGNFMSMDREPDAERAKTIINALERVPHGLVQRMNAVAEFSGDAHSHGGEEQGSGANCAVCWEALLEPGSFGQEKPLSTETEQSSPSSSTQTQELQDAREVIALPCRHVFHRSCLMPWFSRQTTCPSCRFDLDPENLTWRPSVMPLGMPPAQNATAAQSATSPPTATGPDATSGTVSQPNVTAGQSADNPTMGEATNPAATQPWHSIFNRGAAPQSTEQQATPAAPAANEQAHPEHQWRNATPNPANPGVFPPGIPPEIATFLRGLFGENLTPINLAQATNTPQTPTSRDTTPNNNVETPANATLEATTPIPTLSSNFPTVHPLTPTPGQAATATNQPPFPWQNFFQMMPPQFGPPTQAPASATPGAANPTENNTSGNSDANPSGNNLPSFAAFVSSLFGGQPIPAPPRTGQGAATRTAPTFTPTELPFPFPGAPPGGFTSAFAIPRPTAGGSAATSGGATQSQNPNPNPTAPAAEMQNQTPNLPQLPHFFQTFPDLPNIPMFNNAAPPPVTQPSQPNVRPADGTGLPHVHHFTRTFTLPGSTPMAGTPQRRETKKWVVPEGRGTSLRERIEDKEREIGLRCFDPSCGLGPTDEMPTVSSASKQEQIRICQDGGDSKAHICGHAFHSGCLVSAARVAGFGPHDDTEYNDDVEVSCTVCRAQGHVRRGTWDAGVTQLEMAYE